MSHDHDHHDGPTPERALWVALILNAGFLVVEAGAGWYFDSLALLADAGHMVSDVAALGIALVAVRLRNRRADNNYTFGLRRAPVLGGLINAVTLIFVVVFIGMEAVERFSSPPALEGEGILVIGVLGLFVNLGSAWFLARSRDRSVNTRGAMLHLLADALGSVAAIVAALFVMLWSMPLADPVASLVIAILILVGTLPLLRDTVRILLQRAPSGLDMTEVRSVIGEDRCVKNVRDLHLWELDSGQAVLTAVLEVQVGDLAEMNQIGDRLRAELKRRFEIVHATFECRTGNARDCTLDTVD